MGSIGCMFLYHHVLRVAVFPWVSSIPCICDIFAQRALSLPLCTNIPCVSLHHTLPLLCTYIPFIHCMGSIPCMGDLFALWTLFPAPCTYIPCISLHEFPPFPCTYMPCVGDLFALTMLSPPSCTCIRYV